MEPNNHPKRKRKLISTKPPFCWVQNVNFFRVLRVWESEGLLIWSDDTISYPRCTKLHLRRLQGHPRMRERQSWMRRFWGGRIGGRRLGGSVVRLKRCVNLTNPFGQVDGNPEIPANFNQLRKKVVEILLIFLRVFIVNPEWCQISSNPQYVSVKKKSQLNI